MGKTTDKTKLYPHLPFLFKDMIWNSQYAKDPINIVQGDDVDFTVNIQRYNTITLVWEDYDLTGKSLQLRIVNKHGTIVADWTTTGGQLTVALSLLNVDAAAINAVSCCGSFDGQLVEVAPQITLWKGIAKIKGGLI
jgi:hypothetical protein